MSKKHLTTILWDFDGVWSKDYFYKSFIKERPEVWDFIQNYIWGPHGNGKVDDWMRGKLTKDDINKFISDNLEINYKLLSNKLLEDVGNMNIDIRLVSVINKLKKKGYKVAMVSNNMDVFDIVTRPRMHFDQLFNNFVFSSFEQKMLKAEGLFDLALKSLKSSYEESLLIDDSSKARAIFETKGGNTYTYDDFEDFNTWSKINLF